MSLVERMLVYAVVDWLIFALFAYFTQTGWTWAPAAAAWWAFTVLRDHRRSA